jgi:hypothetical protein
MAEITPTICSRQSAVALRQGTIHKVDLITGHGDLTHAPTIKHRA